MFNIIHHVLVAAVNSNRTKLLVRNNELCHRHEAYLPKQQKLSPFCIVFIVHYCSNVYS